MGFLEDWDLTYDEINELLTANPSLRSFVMGYAAEIKCRNMFLSNHPDIKDIYKPDDHDRTEKGDWIISYKGHRIGIEVKSLQSNSLKPRKDGSTSPNYQCDASDARSVQFADGSSVHTTALLVGEFDIVAVNIHGFNNEWAFAWALNEDLTTMEGTTRGAAKDYTDFQKKNLIKTLQPLPKEIPHPYTLSPYELFDRIIEERISGKQAVPLGLVLPD